MILLLSAVPYMHSLDASKTRTPRADATMFVQMTEEWGEHPAWATLGRSMIKNGIDYIGHKKVEEYRFWFWFLCTKTWRAGHHGDFSVGQFRG